MIAFDERRTKRRQLFSALAVFAAVVLLVVGETAWSHSSRLIGEGLFLLGLLLTGIGMVGRAWSMAYIVGNKNITLVKEGPYSLCRNPLYFSSFIAALGVAFCTQTVTIPAILVLTFVGLYRNTILQEESQLRELFGSAFQAYCDETPRFWPSFQNFREVDSQQISPPFFRRGITSLVFFMVMIGLAELLVALHESGLLPAAMSIY